MYPSLLQRKSVLVGLAWFFGLLLLILLAQRAYWYHQAMYCDRVFVHLIQPASSTDMAIDTNGIRSFFVEQLPAKTLKGVQVSMLDLEYLENRLQTNPYIEKADVYADIKGNIHLAIQQRHPVVRLVTRQNTNLYLSKDGKKMPANRQFAARVPIATGKIDNNAQNDTLTNSQKAILTTANYINEHPFWRANVEQLYVAPNNDICLLTKLSKHELVLGDSNSLSSKFARLYTYYADVTDSVGWYKYKTISVKYQQQIICTPN